MDEAQRGEPMAMEIVEAMLGKTLDFIKHCDREIAETEERLKYWVHQRQEMQNFLELDQFEVIKQRTAQEEEMRDVEIAPKAYATTDVRTTYSGR